MTLTLSWSQLRTFDECRQKVKLLKSGKRAKLSDARMFFPGTVTDRVVRDWLTDHPGERGIMPEMVDSIMEREERLLREEEHRVVKWKDPGDKERVRLECIEAAKRMEPILFKYVLPHEYQVDWRFRTRLTIPIGGERIPILLIGAMDIRVHNPEHDWWAVFDVKHTSNNDYWKKTQGQMTFYDLVNLLETGQRTKATALFQPLCDKQVKTIPIDDARRVEMRSRIVTMAEAYLKDDLPFTDRKSQCTYCEFKHACPRFKPVIVGGKKTIEF